MKHDILLVSALFAVGVMAMSLSNGLIFLYF